MFQSDSECEGYLAFVDAIAEKSTIKSTIEADATVRATLQTHRAALEEWWATAQESENGKSQTMAEEARTIA